jgi:hypothetical protein
LVLQPGAVPRLLLSVAYSCHKINVLSFFSRNLNV